MGGGQALKREAAAKLAMLLAVALGALLLVALAPQAAHAAKAKNGTLFDPGDWHTGYNYSKQTTKKYDVTGDGKKDKVTIKPVTLTEYSQTTFEKVKVYVNGKKVGTVKARLGASYTANVTVHVLSNKRAFFFFVMPWDNGDGTYEIYAYKKGKLVKQLSELSIAPDCSAHKYIDKVKASGKKLKVTYNHMTYALGTSTTFTYSYKWKSGKLKRTSKTTSKLTYNVGETGNFHEGKGYLTAGVKLKAYKSMGSSKVKFKVKIGKKAKPIAVGVKGSQLYIKIKSTSGKTGWLKVPKGYQQNGNGGTMFKESFLAG